ncbi:MAG: PaaX protein [Myxococcaceae bacterium]|nr:PaaX protein [Myxococcaceae bacterium]
MSKTLPATPRIALSLLAGARGEPLSAPALVGAAELLGVSANAMRIALSRLVASGDVLSVSRGSYALSRERVAAMAHVQTFRTGFAERVAWRGELCAVVTTHLSRRQAATVRRRDSALALTGFREFRPGFYLRPDNLEGGRVVLAAQLWRLGLEQEADLLSARLDAAPLAQLERLYEVALDAARAKTLCGKVEALLETMATRSPRKLAVETFWLGDEVLRFLARDPLLPESMADPAPRRALAQAMSRLDERAYALWRVILAQLEQPAQPRP